MEISKLVPYAGFQFEDVLLWHRLSKVSLG